MESLYSASGPTPCFTIAIPFFNEPGISKEFVLPKSPITSASAGVILCVCVFILFFREGEGEGEGEGEIFSFQFTLAG